MLRLNRRRLWFGVVILAGVFLILAPNSLPQWFATILGVADGVPCQWLRQAPDLRVRQSILAGVPIEPLELAVRGEPFPTDSQSNWSMKILVRNRTAGTQPILYQPERVLVGDDPTTSGFGIIFRPGLPLQNYASREPRTTYGIEEIRMLGPRQRCYIQLDFPAAAAQVDAETARAATMQAYYRILHSGTHPEKTAETPTLFPNQGLRANAGGIGVILSKQIPLSLSN